MKYRLRLDFIVTERETLKGLEEAIEGVLNKLEVIHPGEVAEEASNFWWEHCYHDATPPKPCQIIQRWRVSPSQGH